MMWGAMRFMSFVLICVTVVCVLGCLNILAGKLPLLLMMQAEPDVELFGTENRSVYENNSKAVDDKKFTVKCHEYVPSDNWSPPTTPSHLQNVSQDSQNLAEHICKEWVINPPDEDRQLIAPNQTFYSQMGQDEFVDKLLGSKQNGFYIECGAATGEELSNTLFFEKSRNWSGILIEANPLMFKAVLHKHRNAYVINVCLSPTKLPMKVVFKLAHVLSGMSDYMEGFQKERVESVFGGPVEQVEVQCFPLYSILKAINVTHVDLFSLDIEGAELPVLYSLPLDEINIDVFIIEYIVSEDAEENGRKRAAIEKYLVDGYGYRVVRVGEGEDIILQKIH